MITTINISDLTTNNPLLILAAMAWNGLYTLGAYAATALRWLAKALLAIAYATPSRLAGAWQTTRKGSARALATAGRFLVTHRRLLAFIAAAVVVVVFWYAALCVAASGGIIYGGLKLVMLHR